MVDEPTIIDDILSPGKSIQIEFVNDHGDKMITKTMVNQLEELYLVLDLPKKEDAFNLVSPNSIVAVTCKHNGDPQDYVFFTKYIRVRGKDPAVVILSKPKDVLVGRHSLRYDVNIPFSYFDNDKEHKDGVVDNLSAIGLLAVIRPDDKLKVGMEIPFKITLPTTVSPLLIVGKIIRIMKEENEHKVAFSFPHIAIELQDQIIKFLFSNRKTIIKKGQQHKAAFIKNFYEQ